MNRRNTFLIAGAAAASGSLLSLTTAFKTMSRPKDAQKKLKAGQTIDKWPYEILDPHATAERAYESKESCMYAVHTSVISQLAEKFGEPYTSFPSHMMKYGHGGIGGYGTVCGALNGAAALIGLLIADKTTQNALITDLFRWYEQTPLPTFTPKKSRTKSDIPASTAASPLCHASVANWVKESGFTVSSKERKERCFRLSAHVAAHVVTILNDYFSGTCTVSQFDDPATRECLTCHSKHGKIDNINGQMSCTSCHSKSIGHRLFGDVHYKLMDDQKTEDK